MGLAGQSITIKHATGQVRDYDKDEWTAGTNVDIIIDAEIEDLSAEQRKFMLTRYEVNVEKQLIAPLVTTTAIAIEDYFTLNGGTYTILHINYELSQQILYCKFEPRTSTA
jgi:hypothetical protein